MGSVASLISEDQRLALRVALHEATPFNFYRLEERCFSTGSLYNSDKFLANQTHRRVFEALGLHEWSICQIWRHYRLVRGVLQNCGADYSLSNFLMRGKNHVHHHQVFRM